MGRSLGKWTAYGYDLWQRGGLRLQAGAAVAGQRLKNLVLLVTAAAYFAATFLGQQMKLHILCEKLLIISQRFFGIPPFRFLPRPSRRRS